MYEVKTSSPAAISRRTMTFIVLRDAEEGDEGDVRVGKTTTAFGKHEWLRSATSGEIVTPMLLRCGVVSANELEAN